MKGELGFYFANVNYVGRYKARLQRLLKESKDLYGSQGFLELAVMLKETFNRIQKE